MKAIKDFVLYLHKAGHGADDSGALFRPPRDGRVGGREKAITPDGCS